MKGTLLSRLERLEQRSTDGVGILSQVEGSWFAIVDGRSQEFQTEHAALACLKRLAETIIIDDI